MAKIKYTKNELKAQNEALRRFLRFLPMLQLKKQQLQSEIQMIDSRIDEKQAAFDSTMTGLKQWVSLFSEPVPEALMVTLDRIESESGNIAGVNIPLLKSIHLNRKTPDLFESPAWLDDAQEVMDALIRLRADVVILDEQRRLISEELRTTAQRVNLFEKVKIPECRENIRIIKIYLGDEQTAAVARGKMAKRRAEKTAQESIPEAL
ncbi:MAG TPA: V-type ATP synthase subunit D [Verrucomicrobia bacterium]|nr:V-type ATP synthase subunit D [Verrucomicrobiota bacterium]